MKDLCKRRSYEIVWIWVRKRWGASVRFQALLSEILRLVWALDRIKKWNKGRDERKDRTERFVLAGQKPSILTMYCAVITSMVSGEQRLKCQKQVPLHLSSFLRYATLKSNSLVSDIGSLSLVSPLFSPVSSQLLNFPWCIFCNALLS